MTVSIAPVGVWHWPGGHLVACFLHAFCTLFARHGGMGGVVTLSYFELYRNPTYLDSVSSVRLAYLPNVVHSNPSPHLTYSHPYRSIL